VLRVLLFLVYLKPFCQLRGTLHDESERSAGVQTSDSGLRILFRNLDGGTDENQKSTVQDSRYAD
jgi:hypothetical protein